MYQRPLLVFGITFSVGVFFATFDPARPTQTPTIGSIERSSTEEAAAHVKPRPASEQKPFVELVSIDKNYQSDIIAENRCHGEVTVWLDVKMTNVAPSKPLPLTKTIPPRSKMRLVRLRVQNRRNGWKYQTYHRCALGCPDSKHDETHLYRLPYKTGESYLVSQSFGGTTSHTGQHQYAVDFAMPEGTSVCAARGGVVIASEVCSNITGLGNRFQDQANFLCIRHPDKTIGVYGHLKQFCIFVRPGDEVRRGEVIALSGNTGWSTGPHLHFAVHKVLGGDKGESVPFLFLSRRGVIIEPVEGQSYVAR
jgi:murein DD-endopeptidase MepM/ murein hydrolase activator NlpD